MPRQRKPWRLPEDKIEIPLPPQAPTEPAFNLLMSVIPPVITIGGSLIFSLVSSQNGSINLAQVIPVAIMSLGFALAKVISVQAQKKKYRQALLQRQQRYQSTLQKTAAQIESLLAEQARILQAAYPDAQKLANLSLRQPDGLWSVWARRREDDDFMALRFGETSLPPSIKIEIPRAFDTGDPLQTLPAQLASQYTQVSGVPALLELNRIGSVALSGSSFSRIHGVARRLVLDSIVHHSPEDLQLFLFAEGRESIARWEWLKWLPHTDSLRKPGGSKVAHLAFDRPVMDNVLEWLEAEYNARAQSSNSYGQQAGNYAAILLLLDETSSIRRSEVIRKLAAAGVNQRIYLIFIGGRDWPRDCRSELRIYDNNLFELEENYRRDSVPTRGMYETTPLDVCERAARLFAGIEAGSEATSADLPESIRIRDVLGAESLTLESIRTKWQQDIPPGEQLIFPVGITAMRGRLELANINLLPNDILGQRVHGLGAYHTILIGTTGSGKSEFMKSLVLGAAVRYPPNLLNFFFMDFKGGAAFGIYESLPHVSGTVTNLSPELVERGLDSIVNEIERRQREFESAQKASDIWEYNYRKKPPHKPMMPHMILFLDEFARGLKDFPRLREPLDLLVRQGRSLGMYLVLANQDVNAEVERLMTNIGWRIALQVSKPEELTTLIGRNHKTPDRKGRGYLRQGDNVLEFQAGYAGTMVSADGCASAPGQDIFQVDADGSFIPWYTFRIQPQQETPLVSEERPAYMKEEEQIVDLLQKATLDLHIRPAQKIYLDPLENTIALEKILDESGMQLAFSDGQWQVVESESDLVALIGKLDMPRECLQSDLVVNFSERDGHLWIIGPSGGGKEMALSALIFSIAQRHTPETCQFYLLDGANDLIAFEKLPHTGALIRARAQDRERYERLLRFLDEEMERRLEKGQDDDPDGQTKPAHIVLFVNNFKEVRNEFDDEKGVIERIVHNGNKARLHLVITSNRGADLLPSFRNNIARKLVLGISNKDEHTDLVGLGVPMLKQSAGRGYWVEGTAAYECQIASISPDFAKQIPLRMAETWQGRMPAPIRVLPACIPLEEFEKPSGPGFVVGRSYDDLKDIAFPAESASPTWLILGKSQTGKSNFLACAARSVLAKADDRRWDVRIYALKRSPPLDIVFSDHKGKIKLCKNAADIESDLRNLLGCLQQNLLLQNQRTLLLIDDLGSLFKTDPGLKAVQDGLNALAPYLEATPGLVVMAAEQYENVQPLQFNQAFIKALKQNLFGIAFSKDTNDLTFLGLSATDIPMTVRRLPLPTGRGIFVDHARWAFVQTPLAGDCQQL